MESIASRKMKVWTEGLPVNLTGLISVIFLYVAVVYRQSDAPSLDAFNLQSWENTIGKSTRDQFWSNHIWCTVHLHSTREKKG
jgi:hypothetical protein